MTAWEGTGTSLFKISPAGEELWRLPLVGVDLGGLAPDGSVFLSGQDPDGSIAISRYSPDGAPLWTSLHHVPGGFTVSAFSPQVWIGPDGGCRMQWTLLDGDLHNIEEVFKLDADGKEVWSIQIAHRDPNSGWGPRIQAVDGAGNLAFGADAWIFSISLRTPDGLPSWTAGSFGSNEAYVYAVAFDSGGNAIVMGSVRQDPCVPTDFGIAKYSPSGTEVWARRLHDGSTTVADRTVFVRGALQGGGWPDVTDALYLMRWYMWGAPLLNSPSTPPTRTTMDAST